jgi:L-arabinokinase
MPEGVEIVAVDCGYECDEAAVKFAQVRSATFMGRSLIDRIIRYDRLEHIRWEGYLSSISINDYKAHFRDRIPRGMKGEDYIGRFGEAIDPLTRIEPAEVYKIRSRTEHHIYEHDRSCKFIECMARAARAKDDEPLKEAGEVMFASHWSYGQRCGLGSVHTDRLVVLMRDAAADGIYGAKITGRGNGGLVAVLKKKDGRAEAALQRIVDQYMQEKNRSARVLRGSMPGATLTGPRAV